MHSAYVRVSTDKQLTEQQRFAILKYAHAQKRTIDHWIEETVSGTTKAVNGSPAHFWQRCSRMMG